MKIFCKLFLLTMLPLTVLGANKINMPYDQVIVGSGTALNKTLTLNINTTATSPGIRANDSTNKLQFSHDGSTWADVSSGITSPLTTKGDVWGYSTVDARIPVGTNGQVLTADSAETLGLKWATPTAATGPRCQFKIHTGNGKGSTDTFVRRYTTTLSNTGACFTISHTAANGTTITIASGEGGLYEFAATDNFTGNAFFGFTLNSSALTSSIISVPIAERFMYTTFISGAGEFAVTQPGMLLAPGDVIRVQTNAATPDDSIGDRIQFQGVKVSN